MFRIIIAVFILSGGLACSKSEQSYVNNPGVSDYLHNRPVGASAHEILAAGTYSSLIIEVQYMSGYQPDAAALDHLRSMLAALVNKPGGITILTKEIEHNGAGALSAEQVLELERRHRTQFTTGNKLALYILFAGTACTEQEVLGIAYRNTSAALFAKRINELSGGLGQASRTKLTATVAEHELGHLLGLVDLGSPMQTSHKDNAHGSHCNNTGCLMYHAAETSDILGVLITGSIPQLDANCRADLRANGGL